MPEVNAPVVGVGIGALVTTGLVSAIAAFCASVLYFHYFPQTQRLPAPSVGSDPECQRFPRNSARLRSAQSSARRESCGCECVGG